MTLEPVIISGTALIIGTLISSFVAVIVANINDKRERKHRQIQSLEDQRVREREKFDQTYARIENYILRRLSILHILSKPIEHRREMREPIIGDHIHLIGESLFAKQVLRVWKNDALVEKIQEMEELFYEIWFQRMKHDQTGETFNEYLRQLEIISDSLLKELSQISPGKFKN